MDTYRSADAPLPDLPRLLRDHGEDGRTVTSSCILTTFAGTVLSKTFRTLTHVGLFGLVMNLSRTSCCETDSPISVSHCWFPYSNNETHATDNSGPHTHLYCFSVARDVSTWIY